MSENHKGNRSAAAQVDENLRRIFEQDAETELPDRLRRLVEMLDSGHGRRDDDGEDDGGGGAAGNDGSGASSGGGRPGNGQGAAAQAVVATPAAQLRIASQIAQKDAR